MFFGFFALVGAFNRTVTLRRCYQLLNVTTSRRVRSSPRFDSEVSGIPKSGAKESLRYCRASRIGADSRPTMQTLMHDLLKSLPAIQDALKRLSESSVEARGEIFTRREVVEFILDLCGYTRDQELVCCRLLELSVGDGDFLFPAVERLIESLKPRARRQARDGQFPLFPGLQRIRQLLLCGPV